MELLSAYDYELPEERIAQKPLDDRAASRLLHLDKTTSSIRHFKFADLPDLLRSGDLLIVNDTRVSAVKLNGRRLSGGKVEALLLAEVDASVWRGLFRPARRLRIGEQIEFGYGLRGEIMQDMGHGQKQIRFFGKPSPAEVAAGGSPPLPPYIKSSLADPGRYQTIYASHDGSAAAPTAGLHFTDSLLREINRRGVGIASVTLNVGLDTFRPVSEESADEHEMHGEFCHVPEDTADAVSRCPGRIIAVGTTSARTIESMATDTRRIAAGSLETKLFIRPGYHFRVLDGMITNFHLPRTTMMLMVAAMCGRDALMMSYRDAIELNYRFLSLGDAMIVL